ncbi:MAG: phosphoribosylaminoimidazolesuccinocarboxamide synthase [bacterium]|nr:phosphoribosylaminoimidazolesuccinocarboxamide synthase [bacterium]
MNILKTVNITGFGEKHQGKVRDFYFVDDKRILITTDRISAFDVILGHIPDKGRVLNLLSEFWFSKTKNIVPNQMVSVPDPNVTVAKNATPIPIEMVVRGYISGVTGTSIWGSYEKGERTIYGIKFPEGLRKNQKLPKPVITPTTKAESGHDERLTREEIIKRKIVPEKIYTQMEKAALGLFERGSKICQKNGLILVDTKYEFGLDKNGKLLLIDEIHTPDSSRFWIKATYKKRFSAGVEPENFDKEFLRLWYAKRGYKGDGVPPKMPEDLIKKVSKRYKDVYFMITGKKLPSIRSDFHIEKRIQKNLTIAL